jgi:diguanylate cyclase (GGDEF)-like protein
MLDIKDLTPKEAMRLTKGMTPDRFLNLLMDYVDNGKYTEEDAIGMFVRAYLDSKTGLWNSESLHSGIAEYIDDARSGKREDKGISVIFGDLDGFKKFNDTYGHGKGDYVLEQFGHVLDRTRRETDKRYKCHRNGGDEFVVVLFGADERGVEAFRERLTKNIKKRKDAFYRAVEGDPESIGFL